MLTTSIPTRLIVRYCVTVRAVRMCQCFLNMKRETQNTPRLCETYHATTVPCKHAMHVLCAHMLQLQACSGCLLSHNARLQLARDERHHGRLASAVPENSITAHGTTCHVLRRRRMACHATTAPCGSSQNPRRATQRPFTTCPMPPDACIFLFQRGHQTRRELANTSGFRFNVEIKHQESLQMIAERCAPSDHGHAAGHRQSDGDVLRVWAALLV